MQDVVDDGLRRAVDRYRERMLVGAGRLQCTELAREQTGRHEMSLPVAQSIGDHGLGAVEIDEPDVASSVHQYVAIGALERGAADHHTAAGLADAIDLG